MYKIITSKKYKTQFKKQNEKNQVLIDKVVFKLSNGEKLEKKYKNHKLKGKYKDYNECHILPDLLLIYQINNEILELYLLTISKHSKLF